MTHDYERAIKFYEETLMDDPTLFDLRTDLAELYIKLKEFDNSRKVLIMALKELGKQKQNDLTTTSNNVKTLLLLSKVYLDEDMQGTDWKFKANPDAKQALLEAIIKQN